MTDRELMQQALQALEFLSCDDEIDEALIVALRHRLEQPEQEPVAWVSKKSVIVDGLWETEETISLYDDGGQPLYTAPPQRTWVGLTDEDVTLSHPYSVTRDKGCFHAGALWADAKLKEKNT